MRTMEKKIEDSQRMAADLTAAITKYQQANGCSRAVAADQVILHGTIISDAIKREKGDTIDAQGAYSNRHWNAESANETLQRVADAQQKADPRISRSEALTRASMTREFAEAHRSEIVRKFG
jgi:hypothetical protein